MTTEQMDEMDDARTREAAERAAGGEFLRRQRDLQRHECPLPEIKGLSQGDVWRCIHCNRRYTWKFVDLPMGAGGYRWCRRFWPWPR